MYQIEEKDNSISFDYKEITQNNLSINQSSSPSVVSGTGQAFSDGLSSSSLNYYGTDGKVISGSLKNKLSEEQMLIEIMNKVNTLSFQLDGVQNKLERAVKAFNEVLKIMNDLSDERKIKRRKLKTKKEE